ncbi:aminopeptidase N [Amaricoccus solimangrovi]|uniref:Aminopeptidase N n=1 Tax=Amaricoccus solimangrovi TaxID=2589815 RepID=A0A501WSD7_9RHOB|nr:aminopeptidase N [Amaricoccus solimangrovi]TPE50187.1 aminopeptidase N [Amaricoccus solimangrovi]
MRLDAQPPLIRLEDYRPPAHLLDRVELVFTLAPEATRVRARLHLAPNPARAAEGPRDLRLDGRLLRLVSATIDGAAIPANALVVDDEGLTVDAAHVPDAPFVWEAETEIAPEANTALEGLYMSKGMYCTQCEAQGFRKITFYPDRPDVMARFRVRVEGEAPVLLSNGNLIASGEGWAEWEDPFPKPSYLFALVAGDLRAVEDRFTTRSGREVLLQIWVRPGDEDRCGYAMDALKRSMKWDEDAYGREYDLDRFMIVAVDDFNMGAMENKGLNVFNSRYVLASPETATDADYKSIETIIAHEYFHNWTGNRITCRDWFQLCLKEGLTVFRDQQFSADQRSAAVKRIEDVIRLRGAQFREDGGPLAHPVRPEEYVEINNFYTATVYEKGAEVIGMLRRLVGPETYRAALDLYFERHDGQACTIEDWIRVFEDASGRDLAQFKLWYSQSGTPRLAAEETWRDGRYTLRLSQSLPPTPGQPVKKHMLIPVAYGLVGSDGREIDAGLIELAGASREVSWELPERPTASLLREFSAPVILQRNLGAKDRAFLLAHDSDTFNKWEAGRGAALEAIATLAGDARAEVDAEYLAALATVADDATLDPAFKALLLGLPSEEEVIGHVAGKGGVPDPTRIHAAREALTLLTAEALGDRVEALYAANAVTGPYAPDAAAAGRRALRARALALITARDPEARAARAQFDSADNMTERMTALTLLVAHGAGAEALARFFANWRDDRLVVDKWFTVQAAHTPPEAAAETVARLTEHPDFEWRNPNRFRSVIGTFAMANPAGFHRADGAGYALFIDWMTRLDPVNPQTAARLTASLGNWRLFDARRRTLLRGQLERLAALQGLSRDTGEIVSRLLRDDDA